LPLCIIRGLTKIVATSFCLRRYALRRHADPIDITELPVVYTRKPNLSGRSPPPAEESSYHSILEHRRSRDRSHCSDCRYATGSGRSSGKKLPPLCASWQTPVPPDH